MSASCDFVKGFEQYQLGQLGWEDHEAHATAVKWKEICRNDFKVEGPDTLIAIAGLRRDQPFSFQPSHNEVGLSGVLRLGRPHIQLCLEADAEFAIVAALLQGLLVAEEYHRTGRLARTTEPSAALRRRAEGLGLLIDKDKPLRLLIRDENGNVSPFFSLIARHGGRVPEKGVFELPAPQPGRSTNAKWVCRCGNILRVGKGRIGVICAECLALFRPVGNTSGDWFPGDLEGVEDVLETLRVLLDKRREDEEGF